MMERSYINPKVSGRIQVKGYAQIVIGCLMNAFYFMDFVAIATGRLATNFIAPVIALMVPGFYLLWCGSRNCDTVIKARKYSRIFAEDQNGIITAMELEKSINKRYFDIFIELEKLFRKGIFINCTLQQGKNPRVIINNAQVGDQGAAGFMQMVCPRCGASTRIRANSAGNCEYCGSQIQAPRMK